MGKTLLSFINHGGYAAVSTVQTIRDLAPGAGVAEAFALQCDQKRDMLKGLGG